MIKQDKDWPREYRPSGFWCTALILCGLVLGVGGIAGAWTLVTATPPGHSLYGRLWLVGICVAFAALGFYCLLWTLQYRIFLFADRIEIAEVFHTTVMHRE